MYLEHFGLDRPPFKITPDTSLFFEGNQRGAALEALHYAIKSGEGIIKVVGEVGSGKTMLCRMLELRLQDDTVDVVYIANPSLSPDNILHVIAHELQLDVSADMSKVDVMQKIQAYLLQKHACNQQVVLFVEEAQSMPVETLEEIRLLSNLETDQNKLLQMVLFGQPELDEKLAQAHIRQLKERITHSFYLTPFPPEDTLQYLNFRLRAVGYRGPDIFSARTAAVIKKYSAGLTRRINILADKALLAAFSEGNHTVTGAHIKSAAIDSEFAHAGMSAGNKKMFAVLMALIVMVSILLLGVWLGQQAADSGKSSLQTRALHPVQANLAVTDKRDRVNINREQAEADSQESGTASDSLALVSKRIYAGRQWLRTANENNYSIQLLMARTTDASAVESFLQKLPLTLDFSKIYIYETVIGGRSWYSVLYNEYGTQSQAIKALKQLPASLQASSPYLRRISAVKKDLVSTS